MLGISYDWFEFFVNQLSGSILVAILLTMAIYYIILLLGKVSFQTSMQIILIAGVYFSTLLGYTKLMMLLGFTLSLLYMFYQGYRYMGREQ